MKKSSIINAMANFFTISVILVIIVPVCYMIIASLNHVGLIVLGVSIFIIGLEVFVARQRRDEDNCIEIQDTLTILVTILIALLLLVVTSYPK